MYYECLLSVAVDYIGASSTYKILLLFSRMYGSIETWNKK